MNKLAIMLFVAAVLSPAFAQAPKAQNNADTTSTPSTSGKPMQDPASDAPQNSVSPKHAKHRKHRTQPKKVVAPPATTQNVEP